MSSKSQANQSESARPSGPGTKFMPTTSPPIAKSMVDIPGATPQNPSGQSQSSNRGKI